MKRQTGLIVCLVFATALLSFSVINMPSSSQDVTDYYTRYSKEFNAEVKKLRHAVASNQPSGILQQQFKKTRLAYKKIEWILEYYFELDVSKFNGPPIDFIEDEDPTANQDIQGLQVIEGFLFPAFNRNSKKELINYISKLDELSAAFASNASSFNPDNYVPDALMEELYRIATLGISGFDSPVAQYSLPEASSALSAVQQNAKYYKDILPGSYQDSLNRLNNVIDNARNYLKLNNNFNSFNRVEFITVYVNPACRLLGSIKQFSAFSNNPLRNGSIRKTTDLFSFDNLQLAPFLLDNELTQTKIELGKRLFFDPSLSSTSKRSCASCHNPAKAFTDGLPKAVQLDGHSSLARNTPTLWNAAMQKNLFHDSRQNSLDDLIIEVLSNKDEMNSGPAVATHKLSQQPVYRELLQKAYPGKDSSLTTSLMVNSISMYLHTLISYNSKFDKHIRGESRTLNKSEINGFNLFMGKAKCGSCHFAPFFNGSKPTLYIYQESEVLGVPATASKTRPTLDRDSGRVKITSRLFHQFAFKTPTIRNVALTAPYMHNGVFKTLEEVVEFYNNGGGKGLKIAPDNQTLPFDKLNLTPIEIKDVVAFMKSLTDTSGSSFTKVAGF